jgi:hypothetical protein
MKRSFLLVLICLLMSGLAAAQPNDAAKPPANKAAKDPEAERLLKERRENAQAMLINLAADAGRFNDQTLRARTHARIADVLWSTDPDRAREMFRKAWDAAEQVDDESRRATLEEMKQQEAKRGSVAVTRRPSLRNEVLRLAARRDRKLGEELLAKLSTEKQREATELADKNRFNPFDSPEAVTQRLNLARQLLDSDVERAMQFADPVLTGISRDTIDFLSYLREKDAPAADQRYAALLGRAAGDLQADANTVSLLSSYLFTPHTFVTFNGGGASSMQSSNNSAPPQVAPELRNAFFRVAGDILLRPLPPPGPDQNNAGLQGKYLMLKRLGPLFDQFAGKELADAVRAQTEALAQGVPDEMRNRDDDTLREGIRPPQSGADREKALLDRIDRAKTSDERDQLYLQLARLYSDAGDLRAREIVDKIEDSQVRKDAKPFIDATMMFRAVDKKEIDRVLELIRIGELTHVQKVWGLTQAARLVYKTDMEKALALLDQADAEARRIETADADRPRAMMAVANTFTLIDRKKAWDAVSEATKAANSAPTFTGEDGLLRVSLLTKGMGSVRSSTARDFDVAPAFTALANDDYTRTLELARLFEREGPRASATIAIARSILEEKKQ